MAARVSHSSLIVGEVSCQVWDQPRLRLLLQGILCEAEATGGARAVHGVAVRPGAARNPMGSKQRCANPRSASVLAIASCLTEVARSTRGVLGLAEAELATAVHRSIFR